MSFPEVSLPERLAMHSTIVKTLDVRHCQFQCSLLAGQYHLLTLTPPLLEFLLGVLPLILLASLDRFQLLVLDLTGLLYHLGNVPMTFDTPYLGPGVTY